jgi:hypothetical protein
MNLSDVFTILKTKKEFSLKINEYYLWLTIFIFSPNIVTLIVFFLSVMLIDFYPADEFPLYVNFSQ